jgi:hypothetical protein
MGVEWMRAARVNAWASSYDRMMNAKTRGAEFALRVSRLLTRYGFPAPVMDLTGCADKDESGMLYAWNEKVVGVCSDAGLSLAEPEYLCAWYWSVEGWESYVSAFNALPEIEGFYAFDWTGRKFSPKVIPIGGVYKSGTSGGNSAVVHSPVSVLNARSRKQ